MSKKNIQINIPEPCHKKFNELIPAQGGNFCDSCEKIVMDFTNMTDNEIAQIFLKNKGKICGQFRKDQLGRKINLTSPPINSYRGKAASLLLSGVLTAGLANAQSNTNSPQTIENQQIIIPKKIESKNKKDKIPTRNSSQTLKILVTDDRNEALIGASILLKDNPSIGTITDINGTAKLVIPSQYTEKDSYIISVSYTGYGTKEIAFTPNNVDKNIVYEVLLETSILLGGSIVVGELAYPHTKTLYNVIKNWYYKFRYNREDRLDRREERREKRADRREERRATKYKKKNKGREQGANNKIIQLPTQQFLISLKNIFPNPFSDELNLGVYSKVKSDIQISIFDISGKKIYHVTQRIIEGDQNIQLNLKNLRLQNGEYILHLREKNGQVQSRKLIRMSEGNFRLKN